MIQPVVYVKQDGRYVARTRMQCPNCEGVMSLETDCFACGATMRPIPPSPPNQLRNHNDDF